MSAADAFFADAVPKTVPKAVVYPFAGGDLSTALTVYPDADEITTLSLEARGRSARSRSPRRQAAEDRARGPSRRSCRRWYRSNFSVTMNMIGAMRGGALPTQLIFSLSALWLHGYEPTSLRYFKLAPDGDIKYLSDDDVAAAEKIKDAGARNAKFANVEFRFHKKGSSREQVYRHILANLDDAHIKKDPSALAYLEKKGHVAGMTKAASYLLTFDDFKKMRQYVIDHVDWMVSDSTGPRADVRQGRGLRVRDPRRVRDLEHGCRQGDRAGVEEDVRRAAEAADQVPVRLSRRQLPRAPDHHASASRSLSREPDVVVRAALPRLDGPQLHREARPAQPLRERRRLERRPHREQAAGTSAVCAASSPRRW